MPVLELGIPNNHPDVAPERTVEARHPLTADEVKFVAGILGPQIVSEEVSVHFTIIK